MKKILLVVSVLLLAATQLSAAYLVVLKDGTRYRAKQKWTVVNGKAMLPLENGTTLQLDPGLIDVAKTDETNRLGGAKLIAVPNESAAVPSQERSLGSVASLRTPARSSAPAAPVRSAESRPTSSAPAPLTGGLGSVDAEVISRFAVAYENVGLFGTNITSPSRTSLRIELAADNEDQVFKAISATSYVMARIPSMTGAKLEMVELFMSTIRGGSAGRFHMSMQDAEAIDKKSVTLEQYFVTKVIF